MEEKSVVLQIVDDLLDLSRKSFNDKLLKHKDQGYKRIGIDLSDKPYLNSESIGVLAYNYVVLHDMGVEIFFVNPAAKVIQVLQSTGLDRVIKIEYTKPE